MAEFRRMVETHLERVGRAIQIRRKELGWSRARLAREIPVDPKTVERWEKARTAGASAELDRIAAAMDTTSAAMLEAAVAEEEDADQAGQPAESPLDTLSDPDLVAEVADLRERLIWMESALEALLSNAGLHQVARRSGSATEQRSG